MSRLLIVANRLPIRVKLQEQELMYEQSEGGLATGLDSLTIDLEKHWIGWPGIFSGQKETQELITTELGKNNIHPVFLSQEDQEMFYERFSNKTIWPLFHYFNEYVEYDEHTWKRYKAVNKLFCKKVLEVAQPDDIIWVQDYHLMLLPGLLREALPHNEIGFFLHIPFPSYELFRTLPWRKELLEGMFGADLVGFHTYEYMRHFISAANRIAGYDSKLGEINLGKRSVHIDSFPMGINYEKFHEAIHLPKVKEHVAHFKKRFQGMKLILSVDRLDYSKGIVQRLKAFDQLLTEFPQHREKVQFLMLVVPSRSSVDQYQSLKEEIDELVGNINGKHATMNWIPVHYYYRSLPFEELAALYHTADIGLVTPLRDGMNLVAKEYVASKTDANGVLILSEMAGAAIELSDALIINPNSISDIVQAMNTAIAMPEAEQAERIKSLQKQVAKQSVQRWANDFILQLNSIRQKQVELEGKTINGKETREIAEHFSASKTRLLLLDYDGTLVPFAKTPEQANPDAELLDMLTNLCKDPSTKTVIISGRDHITLDRWFGHIGGLEIIAEHGIWIREEGNWKQVKKLKNDWKPEIAETMQAFADKTPGAFIEEKAYSLAWHYRKSDPWIADLRAFQLLNTLVYKCSKRNLEILNGNKVIEVKISGVDKGTTSKMWLNREKWDFIIALGDDRTDEDIFEVLPQHAYSIKVGTQESVAKHRIPSWKETRKLLSALKPNPFSVSLPKKKMEGRQLVYQRRRVI
ncbi:MAG: bifunctional alpha,alpha-trehalose-phosphate synthase (UDP-forming)/trehalose-phosphatase [Chitinophagales bacterium]|nr:bifunctional alpha,alpha-trehalose-phosphate synthase (UDP-forming)/trehalose-phosphatase [Chitinophagales bacterium]